MPINMKRVYRDYTGKSKDRTFPEKKHSKTARQPASDVALAIKRFSFWAL